jgi:Fe-S cluster assembly iron-binding protein IscA
MAIEITAEAAEVLRRSLDLGGVEATTGGVRLRGSTPLGGGFQVQVELASGPAEGEEVVEARGVRLFVGPDVAKAIPHAVVALEPQHEVVVVRPASASADEPEDEEAG